MFVSHGLCDLVTKATQRKFTDFQVKAPDGRWVRLGDTGIIFQFYAYEDEITDALEGLMASSAIPMTIRAMNWVWIDHQLNIKGRGARFEIGRELEAHEVGALAGIHVKIFSKATGRVVALDIWMLSCGKVMPGLDDNSTLLEIVGGTGYPARVFGIGGGGALTTARSNHSELYNCSTTPEQRRYLYFADSSEQVVSLTQVAMAGKLGSPEEFCEAANVQLNFWHAAALKAWTPFWDAVTKALAGVGAKAGDHTHERKILEQNQRRATVAIDEVKGAGRWVCVLSDAALAKEPIHLGTVGDCSVLEAEWNAYLSVELPAKLGDPKAVDVDTPVLLEGLSCEGEADAGDHDNSDGTVAWPSLEELVWGAVVEVKRELSRRESSGEAATRTDRFTPELREALAQELFSIVCDQQQTDILPSDLLIAVDVIMEAGMKYADLVDLFRKALLGPG
jgi:hypothetical protein